MSFYLGLKKKDIANLVIKDHVIRFLDGRDVNAIKIFDECYLPEGLIADGKIMDIHKLQQLLQPCVKQWGIKHREVRMTLPDSAVVVRNLQLPAEVDDRELKSHIYMELGASIHLPIEQPVFDVITLTRDDKKRDIMLYAAPEPLVNDYMKLFKSLKLEPVSAEVSPLAVYRLFRRLDTVQAADHVLLVQFDVQFVTASIFKDNKLIFMRQMKMNVPLREWKKEKDHFGNEYLIWTGDPDYLAAEIRNMIVEIERVMSYYRYTFSQGRDHITKIMLTGDHYELASISERMQSATEAPVQSLNQYGLKTAKGMALPIRHYASLGLAMKGVQA
ncbi:type IV pilus biogenesis protein PilM [Paenibacillus silvisoli]|uniref:type IV pilus biogenesis protein PilM n=1 Tax=Paenibacillus silvisoli TaxID=3110539 RepID=UPI0028061794|nr:pilus assembly protein PilM [Paenibacillus silvisoli]